MEERDYFLALGLTPPEPSEEIQEVAELDEEAEDIGEEEQEVADPVENEEEEPQPEERIQTKEEDSKYAAARRKAEKEAEARIAEIQRQADEAIAAEKARADALEKASVDKTAKDQALIDRIYADRNMTNPYRNDSPIKTEADYRQFLEDEAEAQAAEGNFAPMLRLLRELKSQPQQVDIDKIRQEAEAKGRAEALETIRIEQRISRDIKEIKKQDPDLEITGDIKKDWQAVLARPYGQEVAKHLHNMTLLDAFKIGAQDFLIQREKEKALAAAKLKKAGTSHMKAPIGRGSQKEYPIPPDVEKMYRGLPEFRKASAAEIQEMYTKYMRDKEGG